MRLPTDICELDFLSAELPGSYKRYLINGLRRDFGMPGVPIRLLMRTSKNPYVKG